MKQKLNKKRRISIYKRILEWIKTEREVYICIAFIHSYVAEFLDGKTYENCEDYDIKLNRLEDKGIIFTDDIQKHLPELYKYITAKGIRTIEGPWWPGHTDYGIEKRIEVLNKIIKDLEG